jgi:hypothetical protein
VRFSSSKQLDMHKNQHARGLRRWCVLAAAVALTGASWGLLTQTSALKAQSDTAKLADTPMIFTPAHKSVAEAARHFFGIRTEPVQPIPFPHKTHIANKVSCDFCHRGVAKGAVAGLPTLNTCMICHENIAEDKELIIKITAIYAKGEDLPWQRVYGWTDEAHVRFNHAPHIRAEVSCNTCHGDLSQMTVAERVVNHTMGFCVDCHKEKKASNDCLTCHY